MAKKKLQVNWKELFVQKGERIALGVAGVLCFLMILPMLLFAMFGQSAKAVSDDLNQSTLKLKNNQVNGNPDKADLPPDSATVGTRVVTTRDTLYATNYQLAQVFTPAIQVDSTKRQMPTIKTPVEGNAEVALVQMKAHVFGKNSSGETIMVLTGDGVAGGNGSGEDYQKALRQGSGKQGGFSSGNGRNMYGPNTKDIKADNSKPDLKTNMISIDEMNTAKDHYADRAVPVRMAIIEASFPYLRQIEEFQNKLHLNSLREVMDERITDEQPVQPGMQPESRQTFYFLPPLVERRQVDMHGAPLGNWAAVDLETDYHDLLRVNGMRFEPENNKVEKLSFEGLTMPKLAVMSKGQYPEKMEEKLPTLLATMRAMKEGSQVQKPSSNPVNTANAFNVFSKPSANTNPDLKGKTTIGEPNVPTSGPGRAAGDGFPEYCLIRIIDVSIQPGTYYHYRIKVRMGNPNLGLKNVASPDYATRTKPLESEWFEIRPSNPKAPPQVVAVPPEYNLYAVDQQEIDVQKGEKYTGQNSGVNRDREHTAVFQIHKWLDETHGRPSVPVGEWSVAERIIVHRGEFIGRKERVEVPYWRSEQENFVLAVEAPPVGAKPKKGIEVDFGLPLVQGTSEQPYPILVDFENGNATYKRKAKDDKGADIEKPVPETTAGVETLLLSPDGTLLSHSSWADKVDPERVKRVNDWRARIKEVKEGKQQTPGGPMDPFKKT